MKHRPGILAALTLFPVLTACEHPMRPASPAPLQAAADHFGVPVAILDELQQTADQVARSAPPLSTAPVASEPEMARLRRTMRLLEQAYTSADRATP